MSAAIPIDRYEVLQPFSMLAADSDNEVFIVRYRTAIIAVENQIWKREGRDEDDHLTCLDTWSNEYQLFFQQKG